MNVTRYSFRRLRSAMMAGVGVGLAVTAIHACATFLPHRIFRADFSHYYLSACLLRSGADVYAVPLHEYARAVGFPATDLMEWEANPPLLMWLLRPLAIMPITAAFWLYVAIQAVSLMVTFAIGWHLIRGRLSAGAWMLGVGLTLFSHPVLYHFWLSQAQLPLLALIMAGYGLWRRGWNGWATVVFALAGTVKLFPLIFVPLPALAEQGRARLRLFALGFIAVFLFALLPGSSAWISFFEHALPFSRNIAEHARCNFTLPFLVGRLGESAISTAWLRTAVEIATALAVSGFAWWCCSDISRAKTAAAQDSAFCLLLASSLLAAPIAWSHYFVFMIYPLLRICSEIRSAQGRQYACLVALVVMSLLAFNMADAVPAPASLGRLSVVVNNHPVFMLALLYLYFARLTRGGAAARSCD